MARETVRLEGLEGVLATLKSLPPELVSKNGGPVRTAARKALVPMRDTAKANVRKITLEPNEGNLPKESTGLLESAIAVSRDSKFGFKGERFRLKVRRKKYPNAQGGRKRGARTTIKVGALLEYGTEKMRAKPWIRLAFEAHKRSALDVFSVELNKGTARVLKKLERQNRTRR